MEFVFFFFQAEDGIRDGRVTGVQTCALPILARQAAIRHTPPRSSPSAARQRASFRAIFTDRKPPGPAAAGDRKSVVEGKRVGFGGGRRSKKKRKEKREERGGGVGGGPVGAAG